MALIKNTFSKKNSARVFFPYPRLCSLLRLKYKSPRLNTYSIISVIGATSAESNSPPGVIGYTR